MVDGSTQIFNGSEAIEELSTAIHYIFEEHATGSAFLYVLDRGIPSVTDLRDFISECKWDVDRLLSRFKPSDLIIVDSGNTDGGSFKLIFHVGHKSCTLINEGI